MTYNPNITSSDITDGTITTDDVATTGSKGIAGVAIANTFTGTQTVQAAATQDSVKIAGRAGGTSSYGVTVTPTTLTASRTLTVPDAGGTIAVSDSAIDNNRAGFFVAPQGTALGNNLTVGANGTLYGVRYTMPRTITTPVTFVLYCVAGVTGGIQTGVIYNSAGSAVVCTTFGNSWTTTSTGIKTVSFSGTPGSLVAGTSYWFTVWFSNQVTVSGLTGYNGFFGTTVTNAEVCTQTGLLSAPSDLSAASFTAGPGYAPILGVRGS